MLAEFLSSFDSKSRPALFFLKNYYKRLSKIKAELIKEILLEIRGKK